MWAKSSKCEMAQKGSPKKQLTQNYYSSDYYCILSSICVSYWGTCFTDHILPCRWFVIGLRVHARLPVPYSYSSAAIILQKSNRNAFMINALLNIPVTIQSSRAGSMIPAADVGMTPADADIRWYASSTGCDFDTTINHHSKYFFESLRHGIRY